MKTVFSIALCFFVIACKEKPKNNSLKKEEIPKTTKNNINIIPIEHASAVLETDNTTLYIDPVGGAKAFINQKDPDIILITDIHGDHLNIETLESLPLNKAIIIAPKAVADKLPEKLKGITNIVNNGESKDFKGINIKAIPMYNLREEALKFHQKGRGNGYLLTINKERIYFSGDTEDIPEMRALQNIDKAFICMNLPYTMTEESAASAVLEFKPKQVYPYHYRGKPNVSDVAKFKKIVQKNNSKIEVIQLDWYPNNDY